MNGFENLPGIGGGGGAPIPGIGGGGGTGPFVKEPGGAGGGLGIPKKNLNSIFIQNNYLNCNFTRHRRRWWNVYLRQFVSLCDHSRRFNFFEFLF